MAKTSCANGKTVKRSGNLPDAKMGRKIAKIHGAGGPARVARDVVHAASNNYGSHYRQSQQQSLTGMGGYAAGDKD